MSRNTLLLLALLSLPLCSNADPRSELSFYVQQYGGVVPLAQLPRTRHVFTKLKAMADKSRQRWPQLVVVRELQNPPVVSLPDGHIVMGHQPLLSLYRNTPVQMGDARLAFVLGHELVHLADDDFWHLENASSTDRQALEQKADDKGFTTAGLAGFDLRQLLKQRSNSPHGMQFLQHWQRHRQNNNHSKTHHNPSVRRQALQQRWQQLQEQLAFYDMAVALASFGRCQDALAMFRQLQRQLPAREVFNNKGWCQLQLARQAMPPEVAWHYWLPSQLDSNSPFGQQQPLVLRSANPSPLAKTWLEKAEVNLRIAVRAGADYLPPKLNLATTQLYAGKIYQARASIEAARKLQPNDANVQELRAIILHEESIDMDLVSPGIALLQRQKQNNPQRASLSYNLARLSGHNPGQSLMKPLANHPARSTWPFAIQQQVCQQRCGTRAPIPADWQTEIRPGMDNLEPSVLKRLSGWRQLQLAGQQQMEIRQQNQTQALLLDGIVELVMQQSPAIKLEQLPPALNQINTYNGHFLNYGRWGVSVVDKQVERLWLYGD